MQRWSGVTLKVLALLTGLILLFYIGIAVYVNLHKKAVLVSVLAELNRNLHGSVTVESLEPSFLQGFPDVSLSLKNVLIRDSQWKKHKRTLLQAHDLGVSVNAIALVTGTIRINRVLISNASVCLFTDSNGYSNTSVFKRTTGKTTKDKDGSSTEIRRISLRNVSFVLDNRQGNKLFNIYVKDFRARVNYKSSGWDADAGLKILVKNLAFNKDKGSFFENKEIDGPVSLTSDEETGIITIQPQTLKIGGDPFEVGGKLNLTASPSLFSFTVSSDRVLWKRAASLLAANISQKLNKFDLRDPINVRAVIAGDMGHGSKPSVDVACRVNDNALTSPGGTVEECSFDGSFTNHLDRRKPFTDENSQIKLLHFRGNYEGIPITLDTALLTNLIRPAATGSLKAKFPVDRLNKSLGKDLLEFNGGDAEIDLRYNAALVDYQLSKPYINGTIKVNNASFEYRPRRLKFKNSSISFLFFGSDLFIKNVRLQSGKSIVQLQGSIRNFMNLYYTAPEKIILSCRINSPEIDLGQFLGFLSARRNLRVQDTRSGNGDLGRQLNHALTKSKVHMEMNINKIVYNRFTASDAHADITVSETGIDIGSMQVKHAGGLLSLTGHLSQNTGLNHFSVNAKVTRVNIRNFFYSFENFGQKTLSYKNLRGYLFSRATISGGITDEGRIVPRSFNGSVIFDLRKGALVRFEPIQGVGKFAFPFRDLDTITFSNLNGKFDIRGEKIKINPMMISSSVLNMNVAGIYSLSSGTNIALDVPLRNPKKDEDITDKKEVMDRRMKGIVLHILATDGEDGKMKFKWNKNHK